MELKSRSRSHRNESLREDYTNEAADVTSSSALGLLAGRKQLHGVYCHPKSPAGSPRSWGLASTFFLLFSLPSKLPERRHLLISPPLPCFFLCCHKLFSLRLCAGLMLMLMLIMLMPANTMAASKKCSEFHGVWFAIRPANQKCGTFFSPG